MGANQTHVNTKRELYDQKVIGESDFPLSVKTEMKLFFDLFDLATSANRRAHPSDHSSISGMTDTDSMVHRERGETKRHYQYVHLIGTYSVRQQTFLLNDALYEAITVLRKHGPQLIDRRLQGQSWHVLNNYLKEPNCFDRSLV